MCSILKELLISPFGRYDSNHIYKNLSVGQYWDYTLLSGEQKWGLERLTQLHQGHTVYDQ